MQSKKEYTYQKLETDRFIHCSTVEQVVDMANFLFKGQEDLVILCIDEDRVSSEIIFEDLYETGKLFPHIYGPLNVDSILRVVTFPPSRDGEFVLPEFLKSLT